MTTIMASHGAESTLQARNQIVIHIEYEAFNISTPTLWQTLNH